MDAPRDRLGARDLRHRDEVDWSSLASDLSTGLYVLMGWLALIAVRPLASALPAFSIAWLAAGGIAYTAGIIFYGARQLRYGHFIWHLFVVAGTACHAMALLACTS
jgi:hemolysin III